MTCIAPIFVILSDWKIEDFCKESKDLRTDRTANVP